MAILRTDSPISRRIVSSFLDFLDSVQPAPGVDLEGLEVAKDCLAEVFRLSELPENEQPEPNLLVNLFSSRETAQDEAKGDHHEDLHGEPLARNSADGAPSGSSNVEDGVEVKQDSETGLSKDELFGKFFDALERIHFFRTGDDEHVLLDKATVMFHEAIDEMEKSGCQILDRKSLADALKTLGNKAMQSKLYADAIERYSCAIALCEDNAVYYCNRAAAYTQSHKYNEAIKDCHKSIEIDPNYSKAYSRLGLAYYAQGNFRDAIDKGFKKALELDPNNDAVKENIRVAEQKLREEQDRRQRSQDSRGHFRGGPANQGGSPFASMSFESGGLPANLASLFSNLTGNGQNGQSRTAEDNNSSGTADSTFTSRSFGSSTVNPEDIANMFMNMTGGGAFQGQNSAAQQNNGSGPNNNNPFSSMSFDVSALPGDLAGMFRNMGGQPQGGASVNVGGSDEPGIGIGADISLNFGEQTPEELTRTLRSVMGMFAGGGGGVQTDPQSNGDNNNNDGRSPPT